MARKISRNIQDYDDKNYEELFEVFKQALDEIKESEERILESKKVQAAKKKAINELQNKYKDMLLKKEMLENALKKMQ